MRRTNTEKQWSDEDVDWMNQQLAAKKPAKEIAFALDRSEQSVRSKLCALKKHKPVAVKQPTTKFNPFFVPTCFLPGKARY